MVRPYLSNEVFIYVVSNTFFLQLRILYEKLEKIQDGFILSQ